MKTLVTLFLILASQSVQASNPVWERNISAIPLTNEETPSFVDKQYYLEAAPVGVGAKEAWNLKGGKGELVKIYDVETGMNPKQEDLGSMYLGAVPTNSQHGTAVLGILRGLENSYGITGIAPLAQLGFWGFIEGDLDEVVPEYITGINAGIRDGVAHLEAGDVLIIEQQMNGPRLHNPIAVEYWDEIFNELKAATQKGIICIAAAGNGGENFDAEIYKGKFDLKVRDSGCIMVGAGSPLDKERLYFSNYGSRIDAYGYGQFVTSTGYGDLFNGSQDRQYTRNFSGTSSATPIVSGAVAVVSSIAKSQGRVITPLEMRAALRATGTPQGKLTSSQRIGTLPHIAELLKFLGIK